MHHFRVLPTSQEFKNLTSLQKYSAFISWLELPSSEEMRQYDLARSGRLPGGSHIDEGMEEELEDMGYTPEQVEQMKKDVEEINMMKQQGIDLNDLSKMKG